MKDFILFDKRYKYASRAEKNWIEVGHAVLDDEEITLWQDNRENYSYFKYTVDEVEEL